MNDGGSVGRWLALALACASCGGEPDEAGPPFTLDMPLAQSALDNGLELVVVPNHTAPIVTALIGVGAGAAVEDAATNGYSHLFEHMIFQGSEAVPDSIAFQARLDELGVLSNGVTGVDGVMYYFVAPAAAVEPALELFSRAVIAPALDPALLEKEKGVVLGEFDLNESDADYIRVRTRRATLFGDYALHLDALGQRSVVAAATAAELRALHDAYYVPSNALLVLSGDVTPEHGRALAERYFGDWRGDGVAATPGAPEPAALAANEYRVLAAPVSLTTIDLFWRGPNVEADPVAVLAGELLSQITGQSDHPFRGLVGPDLAYRAGLSSWSGRHAGYFGVSLSVRPGDEWAVLAALGPVLQELGQPGNVTAEQLESARRSAVRAHLLNSVDSTRIASVIGADWALGDATRSTSTLDALYDIDPEDLTRFIDTYMRGAPHVMVVMSTPENLASQDIQPSTLALAGLE